MRPIAVLVTVGMLTASSIAHAAEPVHLWSHRFGGTNPDVALGVASDANGKIVMTGKFGQSADFGGGPMTATGAEDMFLAGYDANGVHRWSHHFEAWPSDIAIDAGGNVVVVGSSTEPTDFGGGVLAMLGYTDFVMAKFDPNGVHLWSRRFGSAGRHTFGSGAVVDAAGNIVVIGSFSGTVSFGGGSMTSAFSDVALVKYDANGAHVWSKRLGGASNDTGIAIAVDGSDNIVIAGQFSGTATFGGGMLTSTGSTDVFLAKVDPSGTHQWSRSFGGALADNCSAIAVDGTGSAFLTGTFRGTASFGGGMLTSAGSNDGVVAKYDASGVHQWSQRFGGTALWDVAEAVKVDGSGNVILSGFFGDVADFGGTVLSTAGYRDMFVAKYHTDGAVFWSQRFGSTFAEESASRMALDPSGALIILGYFGTTVDFGGGPLTSSGQSDIVLAKFHEQQPVPVLFTRFDALPRGGAVQVEWDIWSDEDLEQFTLYRRTKDTPYPFVIATGDPRTTHSYMDASVEPGETYEYELEIRTAVGAEFRSPVATATVARLDTSIGPNYPNPFNPRTTIAYTLAERAEAVIEILDVAGSLVVHLNQGVQPAGTHRAVWNGRDADGKAVPSGVYFYRLSGARHTATGKMILLK